MLMYWFYFSQSLWRLGIKSGITSVIGGQHLQPASVIASPEEKSLVSRVRSSFCQSHDTVANDAEVKSSKKLSNVTKHVAWCSERRLAKWLKVEDTGGVSALFSGVSRTFQCVRLVFWCQSRMWRCIRFVSVWYDQTVAVFTSVFWGVRNVAACPPCFQEYSGRIWLLVRLVYWCVQNVAECPSCFLVWPDSRV